uniref:Uncharacterized protein n=1 Tax=Mola mola TaxID=94237 RepID=A0A3Q3XFA5_MOLML
IRPISKTVEIFVTGRDAASLSFFANDGTSLSSSFFCFSSIWCMMFSLVENIWKRTASHIFVACLSPAFSPAFVTAPWACLMASSWEPVSGNMGSSCSTTMCFLSRDHPLTLDFIPFGLSGGSAPGRDSLGSSLSGAGSDSLSFPLSSLVVDSAAVTLLISAVGVTLLISAVGVTLLISAVGVTLRISAVGVSRLISAVGVTLLISAVGVTLWISAVGVSRLISAIGVTLFNSGADVSLSTLEVFVMTLFISAVGVVPLLVSKSDVFLWASEPNKGKLKSSFSSVAVLL